MRIRVIYLLMISVSLVASGAPVTVHFAGPITSTSNPSFRPGAWMTGYFTYDPTTASGQQSSDRPILVVEVPENGILLEMNSYLIGVGDNQQENPYPFPGENRTLDSLRINFYHRMLESGAGGLTLSSTDLSLFSGDKLPAVLPSLERFDAVRSISLFYDFMQTYWGVGARIQSLSVVAGTGRLPVLFDLQRDASGVSFRFLAEPSNRYVVEFTQDLRNWTTLTNIVPTTERTLATINDSSAASMPRFYRLRTE